jgi:hypothetical protein
MALLDPKRYRAAQVESAQLRDLHQRNRDKLNFQRYQSDISKNIADPNIIKAKEQPKTLGIIPKFPDGSYGTDTKRAEWEAEQNRIKAQNYDEFGNRLDVPASAAATQVSEDQMRNLGKLYDETRAHKAGISGGRTGIVNLGIPWVETGLPSFKPGEYMAGEVGPTRWLYDKAGNPVSAYANEKPDRQKTIDIWARNLNIQTLHGQKDPRTDMEYKGSDLLPPDERNVLANIRQRQRTEDLIAEREREAAIYKPSEIETILDMAPGPIRTSHLNEYIEKNKDIVKTIVKDKGLLEKMTDAEFGFNDELIENPEFKKVLQAEVAKGEGKLPVYDKFLNVEPAGAGKLTQDALDVRAGKVTQIQTLTQHANVAKLQGNQDEFNRLQLLISEATQKLKLDDHNIVHLQGMQSLADLDEGDTGLASAVWSEYAKRDIRIIPRTDGFFNIEENGVVKQEKVSKKDLKDNLRLKFDSVWKAKLADEQFRRSIVDYDAEVARGTKIIELNVQHLTEVMKKKMDLKIAETKAQKDTIHFEDDGVFKTDSRTGVVYQMHEREYEDQEGNDQIDAYWKAIRMGPNSGLNTGEVTAFDYKDAVKETTNQPGLSITME